MAKDDTTLVPYPAHPWYEGVQIDNINKALWAIMCEIAYVQKKKAAALNYTFAGEAALIRALRPYMEKYGVVATVLKQDNILQENYQTAKGSQMVRSTLLATVRFTHAPSGTFVDVQSPGEGSDSGDKSINKANTGAYKYALRQTFCIETGDDPDETASENSQRAPKQEAKSNGNGEARTYEALLVVARTKFGFDEKKVQAVLAKHKKFTPADWDGYVKELRAAYEQPA